MMAKCNGYLITVEEDILTCLGASLLLVWDTVIRKIICLIYGINIFDHRNPERGPMFQMGTYRKMNENEKIYIL
jgi:hypothetical protein